MMCVHTKMNQFGIYPLNMIYGEMLKTNNQ